MALAFAAAALACSGYSNDGPVKRQQTERDARPADVHVIERDDASDGPAADGDTDGGAQCCPISPKPDCCMDYGGSRLIRGSCGRYCDGMPWPDAPWRIEYDIYGCPRWVEPEKTNGCCGCIVPDAGN